jgi:hypothetical protein
MLFVRCLVVTLCLALAALPASSLAQGPTSPPRAVAADVFSLGRTCLSGGGGVSSGGGFTLVGAAGQSEAGAASGGGFSISVGFYVGGTAGHHYPNRVMLPFVLRAWPP